MKISYLTWLHEKTGIHSEEISKPEKVQTIFDLMQHLEGLDPKYKTAFKHKNIIYCALNGETVDHSTSVLDTDDLSFYSAIAGG